MRTSSFEKTAVRLESLIGLTFEQNSFVTAFFAILRESQRILREDGNADRVRSTLERP